MSKTPRTDANITWKFDDKQEPSEFVDARICRQLERENEALRKDAERLKKLFEYWEADDKEKFCALIAEIRKEAIKEQSHD